MTTLFSRTVPPDARHQGPFEHARHQLIVALARLQPPRAFNIFPAPDEFTAVKDHIRETAMIFDEWLALIGHEVKDNAVTKIDMRAFRSPFTVAVEGSAMWAVECQADALFEEQDEMTAGAR